MYLRSALIDGMAKGMIEGLSHSREQYAEAVSTLKTMYDRPKAPALNTCSPDHGGCRLEGRNWEGVEKTTQHGIAASLSPLFDRL